MKKFLSGWKIWTILSAMIFFATCGLVVYAQSGSITGLFDKYRTWTSWIWSELDASEWNQFIDSLNSLNEWSIPKWAIMAFNLSTCPEWWTRFYQADNRFLQGAAGAYLWQTWGNSNISLSATQLPPHQHYIKYWSTNKGYDGGDRKRSVVVDWESNRFPTTVYKNNRALGRDDSENETYFKVSTSTYWANRWESPQSIYIQNPYIRVLYCVKY